MLTAPIPIKRHIRVNIFSDFPFLCDYVPVKLTAKSMAHINVCNSFKQGYVYEIHPGQCCGTCIKTSCVFELPGITSQIIVIEVSTLWSRQNQCYMVPQS